MVIQTVVKWKNWKFKRRNHMSYQNFINTPHCWGYHFVGNIVNRICDIFTHHTSLVSLSLCVLAEYRHVSKVVCCFTLMTPHFCWADAYRWRLFPVFLYDYSNTQDSSGRIVCLVRVSFTQCKHPVTYHQNNCYNVFKVLISISKYQL